MTHILLISDTDRVKQVFESLEKKDSLRLRTASTLVEADQELSGPAPQFTFVQSRISGFSGDIILRHLKKSLPEGAKIILLAGDADEVKQAHKHAVLHLDLTLDDAALAQAVQDILEGVSRPREVASASRTNPVPAAKRHKAGPDAKAKEDSPVIAHPKVKRSSEKAEVATAAFSAVAKPEKEFTAAPVLRPAEAAPPVLRPAEAAPPVLRPAEAAPPESDGVGPQSFEELMRRASSKGEPPATGPSESAERIEPGADHAHPDAVGQLGLPAQANPAEDARPVSAAQFRPGEPLADALRRTHKKKRPTWVFALALALVVIPFLIFTLGKKAAPPPEPALKGKAPAVQAPSRQAPVPPATTAAAPAPAATPARPPAATGNPAAENPATRAANPPAPTTPPVPAHVQTAVPAANPATPAAKPAAKPETKSAAKPEAKPAAKPEPRPAVKAGLKTLPAIVSGTRLDAAYGKTHPGWQRYIGTRVEFKVFKEAGVYRALQILTRSGEPIPDQLFKRILVDFGGVSSYQVKSTSEKGKYLVEQGMTKGGVALTIYRNKGDRGTKAFVIYYR